MTINPRPYRNIPTQHKPLEWGNIIILAFIFAFLMWQCTGLVVEKLTATRTLSPVEKAEHDRLRMKHGLQGFSVILVKDKGLFFLRDGRLNKFQ